MTVIPLGRALPHGSSHLPADSVGHVIVCLLGVAPRRDWPFHSPHLRNRGHRLCSSNPRLTADGSYPLRCPVESRLSSVRLTWHSDRLACFTHAFYARSPRFVPALIREVARAVVVERSRCGCRMDASPEPPRTGIGAIDFADAKFARGRKSARRAGASTCRLPAACAHRAEEKLARRARTPSSRPCR